MTDPTPTPTPDPTPAPWHAGIDAETLGHWQNKGWKIDDPKEIAIGATKQARELEKHFGVPAENLLKMPKADAKPEEIKAFWGRLGAPADAKDYDFSGIKMAGDRPLDPALADAIRSASASAYLPKDAATKIAQSVAKHLDDARTAELSITAGKLAEEKTLLAKDWAANFDFNHLKAMEGARRLGITPEAVKAMEGQIGYRAVMEAMRKIGAGTSEDSFHEGNKGPGGNPTTRDGAVARKAELMADKAWAERYLKGGTQEKNEMTALNTMIDGNARAA